MLLTTSPNKAKCLPIVLRWLPKFGFVLPCLHFYCPLTFCFPFSSVLCHVLQVSSRPSRDCYMPVLLFLSSPSLLLSCRALIVFPFTLPFAEPSHLLYSFLFPSPAPLWKSSTQVSASGLHAFAFQRVAIKGLRAKPDDSSEKTDSGSRVFFFIPVSCAMLLREKRAE